MSLSDLVSLVSSGWDLGPRKYADASIGYDNPAHIRRSSQSYRTFSWRSRRASVQAAADRFACAMYPEHEPVVGGNRFATRARCDAAFFARWRFAARLGTPVGVGTETGSRRTNIRRPAVSGILPLVYSRQLHDTVTTAALADVDEAIRLGRRCRTTCMNGRSWVTAF